MALKESIRLIGDRVLVKPVEPETTSGGIVIPDSVKDKQEVAMGYVARVGPGYAVSKQQDNVEDWINSSKGGDVEYIPLSVEVGFFVIFFRGSAVDVEIEGEPYKVVPQGAILLYDRGLV